MNMPNQACRLEGKLVICLMILGILNDSSNVSSESVRVLLIQVFELVPDLDSVILLLMFFLSGLNRMITSLMVIILSD